MGASLASRYRPAGNLHRPRKLMISRNITKSLPKEQVQRLIRRWHSIRQSGYTKAQAEKRVGYTVEKMTRWAASYGLTFES